MASLTALVIGGASALPPALETRAQQEQRVVFTQSLFSPDERCSTRDVRPGKVYEWQLFASVPKGSAPVSVNVEPHLPVGARYVKEQPPQGGVIKTFERAGEYVLAKYAIVFDAAPTNKVLSLSVTPSGGHVDVHPVVLAPRWDEGVEMIAQKVRDARTPALGEALEVYVSARGRNVAIEETSDFRSFTELYRNSTEGESFALRFPLQGVQEKAFYRVRLMR